MSPKHEIVAGKTPVLECLRAGKRAARKLYLLNDAKGMDAIRRAAKDIPTQELNRRDLDALTGGVVHQGAVLEADPLPVVSVDTWLSETPPDDAVVVVLDGIEDPHNFGAIVRSASACGVQAVVFGKDRAAPLSTAAVKSAAGAMEYMNLVRATNLVRALEGLKSAGFWITALDAEATENLWEADLTGRAALVVGSEGRGIRRLVREHCDRALSIPLRGPITSLNVSASVTAALYECMRQRAS